jgi:hypothetical protein
MGLRELRASGGAIGSALLVASPDR